MTEKRACWHEWVEELEKCPEVEFGLVSDYQSLL